jgi:hypothetical protein
VGARRLRSADGLLAPAVAETVTALTVAPEDAAAVKLAERYAEAIDEAASIAAAVDQAVDELDPDDITGRQRLAALAAKVEAQTVLEKLGPKLLAALESLGATPAARAKLKGGAPTRAANRLQALRQARA